VNRGAFWFLQHEDATTLPDLVVDLVTRRLPKMPGVKPGDIQVLSPGRTTPGVGSEALARRLHEDLNPLRPGDSEHRSGDRSFRLGDRVMPVRNDRHKGPHGVFNGSVGTVVSMDTDRRELEVLLDDGDTVPYGYDELDTLIHAYAITVHRAQGSEYPVVVIPLTTAFTYTLQRNLLYTAVTRARRQLVLVGQDEALKRAINTRPAPRWTGLAQRLCTALEAGPVVLTMNGDGQITLC
jgi:exodeoxyribonuclease V alpha subunit